MTAKLATENQERVFKYMETVTYNKACLVDLENVGANALYQYINGHQDCEYIIFHSDNTPSPGVILEEIPETVKVSFVDCRSGGNNAMDFCICAMAGMLAKDGCIMKILSNDKGYDPILYMLHQRGIRIKRENTPEHLSAANIPAHKDIPEWRENVPIIKAIRSSVPRQYQNEVIAVLPGAVSRKEAHEMLQAILPQKIVAETYRKLKKHIPREVV